MMRAMLLPLAAAMALASYDSDRTPSQSGLATPAAARAPAFLQVGAT